MWPRTQDGRETSKRLGTETEMMTTLSRCASVTVLSSPLKASRLLQAAKNETYLATVAIDTHPVSTVLIAKPRVAEKILQR